MFPENKNLGEIDLGDLDNKQSDITLTPPISAQAEEIVADATPEKKVKPEKKGDLEKQAELIAQAIIMANQHKDNEIAEQKRIAELKEIANHSDTSASAVENFKARMKAAPQYDFHYYPSLAKVYGNKQTIVISGYSMVFLNGYVTKVPLPMLDEINVRFGMNNLWKKSDTIIGQDMDNSNNAQANEAVAELGRSNISKIIGKTI